LSAVLQLRIQYYLSHPHSFFLDSDSIHIVGLNNGGLGRSCAIHDVCGSAITEGSILCLRHVVTCRGDELHAYLFFAGNLSCKVGFAAKQQAEDAAAELDGTYLRVQSVVTCNNEDISCRRRMYKNYGSAQAVIIEYIDAVSESYE
jgi:hypothetical protein